MQRLTRGSLDPTICRVKANTQVAGHQVLSRGSRREVGWGSSVLADGRRIPTFLQGVRGQGGREVGGPRKEAVSVFFPEPFPVFLCRHLELLSALCILAACACSTVCFCVKIPAPAIRLCPPGGHKAGLPCSCASRTQHCVECAQ